MQLKNLFAKSIFWKSAYFFSVLLLNLGIARYFSSSGSASIYYFSTVYAFVVLLSGISLESGMGYFAARNKEQSHRFLNLGLLWTFVISVLACCLAALYSKEMAGDRFPARLVVFSAVCFISGNLLVAYCSALFYARSNFHTPNLVGLVCNLTALLLLLFTGSLFTPDHYLYLHFSMSLAQGLILTFAARRLLKTQWQLQFPDRQALRELLKYSFTAYIANILFMLVYRVDYWFVEKYCSKEELGNYIQVSKLNQMLVLVPSFLATAVFPVVASGRKQEVFSRLGFLSRISLIVIGTACILIGVTGHPLFPFFFGDSFQLMTLPFLLLIPGILSLSSLYPLSAYYSGKNRVGVNLRGSLLALVFIVIADYLFVPRAGIPAAAAVSSIGYMLFHAYVLFIFRKEYGTPVSDFLYLRRSDFQWIKNSGNKLFYP